MSFLKVWTITSWHLTWILHFFSNLPLKCLGVYPLLTTPSWSVSYISCPGNRAASPRVHLSPLLPSSLILYTVARVIFQVTLLLKIWQWLPIRFKDTQPLTEASESPMILPLPIGPSLPPASWPLTYHTPEPLPAGSSWRDSLSFLLRLLLALCDLSLDHGRTRSFLSFRSIWSSQSGLPWACYLE